MFAPHKILVALDFSAPSEHALVQGNAIALATGAKLLVCHSVANVERVNALFPQLNWLDALAVPKMMEAAGDVAERRIQELTGRTRDDVLLLVDHGPAGHGHPPARGKAGRGSGRRRQPRARRHAPRLAWKRGPAGGALFPLLGAGRAP